MLSKTWSGATAAVALAAGVALLYTRGGRLAETRADDHSTIRGVLVAEGIDPLLCVVSCTAIDRAADPRSHRVDLDREGSFALVGLVDTEYRLEIAARSNPALRVARGVVRPGEGVARFESDPAAVFGAASRPGLERD